MTPLIIAGPCGAETRTQTLATCEALAGMGIAYFRAGVWKPRTHAGEWEGAGEEAFAWLQESQQRTGIPFGVEVGNAHHVKTALQAGVSMVWLGARTTSNPFSVREIAEALHASNIKVWVKNPLAADVELWSGAVERLLAAGVARNNIGIIHRGFPRGDYHQYRNPPAWHLAIEMHSRYPDLAMLCDPSHIAGRRDLVAEIAQRAADLHYDGLFVECHCNPDTALSDAAQQLLPAELKNLLSSLIWRNTNSKDPAFTTELERLRNEIDALDAELLSLLAQRMTVSERVGIIKRTNNVAILQPARWQELLARLTARATDLNLSPDFIRSLFNLIHDESIAKQ